MRGFFNANLVEGEVDFAVIPRAESVTGLNVSDYNAVGFSPLRYA